MKEQKDILLVDKPGGWTSFDVVAKIRGKMRADYKAKGVTPTKKQLKVGHAGTLDPFATGLLIILLGDACKRAGDFLKLDKTYEFTAKLGEVSTTGDPEGDILEYAKWNTQNGVTTQTTQAVNQANANSGRVNASIPSVKDVTDALKQFRGEIDQVPPAFSAIKVNGQRAYKLARAGTPVEMASRKVNISRLELVEYSYPFLKCVCDVSSGTYIRSLVQDIGVYLRVGAYCQQLRRTRIGEYKIESVASAQSIPDITEY